MPTLPVELQEEILTALVDSYGDEPAYQWTQLRRLSPYQRSRIEKHFEQFWLPKVTCTVHVDVGWSLDYTFESTDAQSHDGLATFKHALNPEDSENICLQEAWVDQVSGEPTVILRCGESFLKRGLPGGHMISDIKLPDLELTDEGLTMRFDWRKTLDALFREEIMLEKLRDTLLENAIRNFSELEKNQPDLPTLNQYLIKRLCLDIQMPSRTAVIEHRHARANTTGQSLSNFDRSSSNLNRSVSIDQYSHPGFDRPTGPTIYEIALQEESMVLSLPGWQTMDEETLYNLYAEEFGWACCIMHKRTDDMEFQRIRRDCWRAPRDFLRLRGCCRYDPLG